MLSSPDLSAWPVRWRGKWIWDHCPNWGPFGPILHSVEPENERDAVLLFRRRIELDPPASVPIRVTADGRYALWVNGVEVSRGPIRSEATILYWDEIDLGPYL